MPNHPRLISRTEPLLGAFVLATAGVAASTFFLTALGRLRYPYEIEWLESEMLHHAARVLSSEPLYAAPSAAFASTIYPPLYAWASALMARIVGLTLLAPRLVSVLASLAIAFLCFRVARRLSGSTRGGVLAATLALAAYVPTGTVLDLARIDALWVLLLLLATTCAERAERPALAVASGALLALGTLSKQPTALFVVVLAAELYRRRPSAAVLLAGSWAMLTGTAYLLLHAGSGGWSTTYLVWMPLRVPHQASAFLHLFRDDLLHNFAPAVGILLLWGLTSAVNRPGGSLPAVWWVSSAAAATATVAMRTLQGGDRNGLLPLAVFGALIIGTVAGRVLRHGSEGARIVLLVALALQFSMLCYNPASLVPSLEERARARAFVARLAAIPGPVWVPSHTSYAFLAGKPFLVHRDPLLDLLYTGSKAFPEDLLQQLERGAFAAVVTDGPFAEERLQKALESGYEVAEILEDMPVPLVGYRTQPTLLYQPRPSGP